MSLKKVQRKEKQSFIVWKKNLNFFFKIQKIKSERKKWSFFRIIFQLELLLDELKDGGGGRTGGEKDKKIWNKKRKERSKQKKSERPQKEFVSAKNR